MERCWRANANARPPTPPPAIATVAFVVGGCGAPVTMPRPAHVSQRLRGGGPPFRRRLRDLVYMLPTLLHASHARQASTAAAPVALRAAQGCCSHRTRAPLDRRNGVTRRTNNSIISIVYGIAIASLAAPYSAFDKALCGAEDPKFASPACARVE